MARPVWSFEEVRDTNAPVRVVAARLMDPSGYARWHARLQGIPLEVREDSDARFEAAYAWRPGWGIREEGAFEVTRQGERTLLRHRARFKGWPVLLLMGWWRFRSHRMWERFVGSL